VTETRLKKKHRWHVQLKDADKSAIAEHSVNLQLCIHLHYTNMLSIKPRHMDCMGREEVEVDFNPNSMKREHNFCLSKSLKPLISLLKSYRKPPQRIL
jgi:hypothetical protein